MIYEMTQKTMVLVVQYLGTRPYQEVAGLIKKLQEEFKLSDDRQNKVEPKKVEHKKVEPKKKK